VPLPFGWVGVILFANIMDGKIWLNTRKHLFLQEIINSKTKNMKNW
jgi:hypothetical protein